MLSTIGRSELAIAGRHNDHGRMRAQGTKRLLRRLGGIALAAMVAGPPTDAAAQPIGGGDYETCMRRARTDPDRGLAAALAWRDRGGGDAARHCAAVALIGLGRHVQAAARLEALAGDIKSAGDRAAILAQAGAAWFQAGDYARAHAAQSAALALSPSDPEILIDRAMTLAGAKNYWEAIDDLNRVVAADRENFNALILRASAYRYVDALELAHEDAAAAFRLAPSRPEILLEYGIVLRLSGDRNSARRHWLTLIRLHDGIPAADTARRNLELLDLRVKRPKIPRVERPKNLSRRNVWVAGRRGCGRRAGSGSWGAT